MSEITPRKRRRPIAVRPLTAAAEAIRLLVLPDALNGDGEPRAALLVPPASAALSRRPLVRCFASMAAAIAAKGEMEAVR